MLRELNQYRQNWLARARLPRADYSLQIVLWMLWTTVVVVTGYVNWHTGVALIGVVIRCLMVGIIGLVVLTKVEMRLQPWRFLD